MAAIFGIVAGKIWESKGAEFGGGFWWGFLLGPLGLAYVAFAQPKVQAVQSVADDVELQPGKSVFLRRDLFGHHPMKKGAEVTILEVEQSTGRVRVSVGKKDKWLDRDDITLTAPSATEERTKTCPRCAERIKEAALVCRFCGHEFEGASS